MAESSNSSNNTKQNKARDEYFMATAFLAGMQCKDPETKGGACIVNKDQNIVSVGFSNGCPSDAFASDKNWESYYVCHAEMNAILNANRSDLAGCKMYVTMFPCNECAKLITQSKIGEVIYYSKVKKYEDEMSMEMFDAVQVHCRQYKPEKSKIEIDFSKIKTDD